MALSSRAVFIALLAVYLVTGTWALYRTAPSGDQVFYFMAADSLLRGEGLDLTQRWRELPGASYQPGHVVTQADLERQTVRSLSRTGRYPPHDLGLSLLIALPFALGGRALVLVAMCVAMAAALALSARIAIGLGAEPRQAHVAALLSGIAVPALTYSGLVFPDAVAPLAVAVALGGLVGVAPPAWAAIAVAALPVLHLRYWPLALVLLAAHAQVLREPHRIARFAAPLALSVAVAALVSLAVYGLPIPHAGFVLFFTEEGHQLGTYRPDQGIGVVGLFVDRAFGLLPAAPLAALVFVGAGLAVRLPRARTALAVAAPYLVLASLLDWTGGWSPQARYLAPLIPVFVALTALAFSLRWATLLALPLGLWTAAQSGIYSLAPWLRNDAYGVPPLADGAWRRIGQTPSAVFPLFGTEGATLALAAGWCVALAVLGVIAASHGTVSLPAWTRRARRRGERG